MPALFDENVDRPVPRGDGREGHADGVVIVNVERLNVDGELFLSRDFAQLPRVLEIAHRCGDHMP